MFSATRLLGGLVSHGFGRTARNALGGGGMMGTAAKVAGVAAVGGAAYAAYRHYQAGGFGRGGPGLFGGGQPAAPPGPGGFGGGAPGGFAGAAPGGFGGGQATGFTDAAGAGFGGASSGGPAHPAAPPTPQATPSQGPAGPPPREPTSAEEEQALLLVRAMIAAANVDGQIDGAERQRILQGAANAGFGPEEQQALEQELASPQAPNVLLGQVRSPDLAAQFYLVTLLATDLDNDPERTYVKALPLILQLPAAKVGEIHQQLGVPPVA